MANQNNINMVSKVCYFTCCFLSTTDQSCQISVVEGHSIAFYILPHLTPLIKLISELLSNQWTEFDVLEKKNTPGCKSDTPWLDQYATYPRMRAGPHPLALLVVCAVMNMRNLFLLLHGSSGIFFNHFCLLSCQSKAYQLVVYYHA